MCDGCLYLIQTRLKFTSNLLDLEVLQIQYYTVQYIFSNEPLAQCVVLLSIDLYEKALSGRARELKTQRKSPVG